MALLDGLDAIDWTALHHAYGPASDVPELLRALVDPSSASEELRRGASAEGRPVRQHVEWILYGNVFHQGTVWQASATTVPFFVEILQDGPGDDDLREFVLGYLHHLALGYPEDLFPEPIDPQEWFAAADGREDPGGEPDYDDELLAVVWARDCYRAVESSLEELVGFVDSPAKSVALEAIALMAAFPRRRELSAPRLRAIAERSGGVRAAHAIVSLAALERAAASSLAERLVLADDPLLAVHAACASMIAAPQRASERALLALTAPLGELAEARSVHTRTLSTLVGRCLALVPGPRRERAIEALARQHEGADPLTGLALTRSLLALAFAEPPAPRQARDLTPAQRQALEAIRDHGAFRLGDADFANYGLLLGEWDLPDTRDRLSAWLRGDGQDPEPTAL